MFVNYVHQGFSAARRQFWPTSLLLRRIPQICPYRTANAPPFKRETVSQEEKPESQEEKILQETQYQKILQEVQRQKVLRAHQKSLQESQLQTNSPEEQTNLPEEQEEEILQTPPLSLPQRTRSTPLIDQHSATPLISQQSATPLQQSATPLQHSEQDAAAPFSVSDTELPQQEQRDTQKHKSGGLSHGTMLPEHIKTAINERRVAMFTQTPVNFTRLDMRHMLDALSGAPRAGDWRHKGVEELEADNGDSDLVIPVYHRSGRFCNSFVVVFRSSQYAERAQHIILQKKAEVVAQTHAYLKAHVVQMTMSTEEKIAQVLETFERWGVPHEELLNCLLVDTPHGMSMPFSFVSQGFKDYNAQKIITLPGDKYIVKFAAEHDAYLAMRDYQFGKFFRISPTPVTFRKMI